MHSNKSRQNFFWVTCFCAASRAAMMEANEEKLARLIQKGNISAIERGLRKIKRPLVDTTLIVRRRHLSTAYPCLVDHRATGTDPFINFYQECSPVIWAVDCLQWQVLPFLSKYGLNINRPQTCRRWTYICAPNSRPNTAPYRRFWTRGHYTYQSALDYFFASVYEFVGEQPANYNGLSGPSPLTFYFSHLPTILTKGVDVHRIDSVIVFNNLATSFDQYLCRYTNEHATVPDIPENDDAFVELTAVKRLIENGFSQFECMEYLYPCCNWFGILLCLVCHPKINTYGQKLLPPIVRQAALLLINLLTLKCTFPSVDDFTEGLENLHLRKVYSKRYGERRDEFNNRLASLHQVCQSVLSRPLSLKLLARNAVRKRVGGVDFCRKVASLGLPAQLCSFIQYIGPENLKSSHMEKQLIRLAQGYFVEASVDRARSFRNELLMSMQHHLFAHSQTNQANGFAMSHNNIKQSHLVSSLMDEPLEEFSRAEPDPFMNSPLWRHRLRRGRASERLHMPYEQRSRADQTIGQSTCSPSPLRAVRPTSAPLPRIRLTCVDRFC